MQSLARFSPAPLLRILSCRFAFATVATGQQLVSRREQRRGAEAAAVHGGGRGGARGGGVPSRRFLLVADTLGAEICMETFSSNF